MQDKYLTDQTINADEKAYIYSAIQSQIKMGKWINERMIKFKKKIEAQERQRKTTIPLAYQNLNGIAVHPRDDNPYDNHPNRRDGGNSDSGGRSSTCVPTSNFISIWADEVISHHFIDEYSNALSGSGPGMMIQKSKSWVTLVAASIGATGLHLYNSSFRAYDRYQRQQRQIVPCARGYYHEFFNQ